MKFIIDNQSFAFFSAKQIFEILPTNYNSYST